MHRPPEPHLSFTIPSIHDDTTLDCRIYHPEDVSNPQIKGSEDSRPWRTKGIVMAHPYAPMGGSYDDRVVGIVVEESLSLGYFVGTFNFRGAHGSKGRTSWTGKPELNDYISFAAFFIHYLSYLNLFPSSDANFMPDQSPISPPSQNQGGLSRTSTKEKPLVILGGYSYGSLILRHLPPILPLLQSFSMPLDGTATSEILLRARKLADQSNQEWINLARDRLRQNSPQKGKGHENKLSVTIGGEETSPDVRRSSREIRRSMEGSRSLDLGRRMRSLSHRRLIRPQTPPDDPKVKQGRLEIEVPDARYLLISPLVPPLSTLAATGLGHKFWNGTLGSHHETLVHNPTLAIYGDQDGFASAKKVQQWTKKLCVVLGTKFSFVEVAGAGHFWHEPGVERQLRDTLKAWERGKVKGWEGALGHTDLN
ncbi:uncharacterized protein BDR25DRAFT_252485 [Lindgomyces ingoldianus]|uniref:Uncharacterized protein n=1 Tax=Lindgomyces ingoldianus TaxID=673940 RepID=A0ACB6RDR1_9PLEO|nr:uncharacterized protein BDR25DRAFT_252485 [Lindgomyces ingoldianus]KAF2476467.1 hypothetical protein BDR25DRAFT_252485 [Lindgomyces ingoldianus]